jgi:membrane-associated phospholipid phosphatase
MSRIKKAAYTSLMFLTYLLMYTTIQYFVQNNELTLWTSLDASIPFMPEFVWLYHTLPLSIFMVMVCFIQSRRLFMITFWACIIACITMSILHVSFPIFYPREDFVATSLHEYVLELTQQVDGANNTFPSGHAAFSWLMYYAAKQTKLSKEWPTIGYLFLLWAIGISLSTLVIKQHFVIDVFSGWATAIFSFYMASLFIDKRPTERLVNNEG